MLPRKLALLALLSLSVTALVGASPAAAAGGDESSASVRRVLVFSVPTLSWADLREGDLPNLTRVLRSSAIADLSVRSVTRRTSSTDGYATLNAGTRARGTAAAKLAFLAGPSRSGGSDDDGDPIDPPHQVFEAEPPGDDPALGVFSDPEDLDAPAAQPVTPDPNGTTGYRASAITQEFARRTGVEPRVGQVFNFGLVPMLQANDALYFGSEIGALGTALSDAGVHRGAIANGDHPEGSDVVAYSREAATALMDHRGIVSAGRVGTALLESHPDAPFGTRYDNEAVAEAFAEFWKDRSVVLVEASDLVRYEDFKDVASESQRQDLHRAALGRSDELLGLLMSHVDASRDAVVVVAPWARDSGTSLTVLGLRAPGIEPGLLSSGTTRRDGYVQTVDVAPSILTLLGIDPPSSMEGTPVERSSAGGTYSERIAMLDDANSAAQFRDDMIGSISTFFVVAQILLWILAALAISRRATAGLRLGLEVLALALLVFLPTTFLAGVIPFFRWGGGWYWAFVLVVPALVAMVVHRVARGDVVDPVLVVLGGIVGFLSIDVVAGAPLQFNTVFGYTPTVAGRFAGLGNPAFSMLTAAGLLLAGLLAHRVGGRRGNFVAAGLLVWCLLLDGLPFWGADVGGALTLVPTVGIVVCLLFGIRVRLRTAAIGLVAAVVVTTLFGLVDLTRPPERRSHLGRLLADIGDNGVEALQTVIIRKLIANLSVILSSVWTLMVPVAFIFLAYVIWRAPGRMQRIAEVIPQQRPAAIGLVVAMLLGFALNDSGISVPGLMLGVTNATLVFLLVRVAELGNGDDQEESAGGSQRGRTQSAADGSHDLATT